MPVKLQFETGEVIEFDREPTQEEAEFAYHSVRQERSRQQFRTDIEKGFKETPETVLGIIAELVGNVAGMVPSGLAGIPMAVGEKMGFLKPGTTVEKMEQIQKVISQPFQKLATKRSGEILKALNTPFDIAHKAWDNTNRTLDEMMGITPEMKADPLYQDLMGSRAIDSALVHGLIDLPLFGRKPPTPSIAGKTPIELGLVPRETIPQTSIPIADPKKIPYLERKQVKDIEPELKEPYYSGEAQSELFIKNLKPGVHENLAKAGLDFFKNHPEIPYKTSEHVVENLALLVDKGLIGADFLKRYNLTPEQFIPEFRASTTASAQRMAHHSLVTRQLRLSDEEIQQLKAAGHEIDDGTIVRSRIKQADDVARAMMLTQPATAVVSTLGSLQKIGLGVFQSLLDSGIQKMLGKQIDPEFRVHPLDGLVTLGRTFVHNPSIVRNIIENYPGDKTRLYSQYASDLFSPRGTGNIFHRLSPEEIAQIEKNLGRGFRPVLDRAEAAGYTLNILLRASEKYIREGVFQAEFAHQLRNRGYDFDTLVTQFDLKKQIIPGFKLAMEDPKISKAISESVKIAVEKALDATWAKRPRMDTATGKIWTGVIEAINRAPFLGTYFAPFANYLYNHMKFVWEQNPTGLLKFLNKREREAFRKGDVSVISKAILGAGMFGTAAMIVNSEWYSGKPGFLQNPDTGELIDIRSYGAYPAFWIYLADLMKRSREDRLYEADTIAVVEAMSNLQLRGGLGINALDSLLGLFTVDEVKREEKLKQFAQEYGGELAGRYATPVTLLRDIYDEITDGMTTVRDVRTNQPLLDPTIAKIPVWSRDLPEIELPTKAGPIQVYHPMIRQIFGLRLTTPFNDVEKEFNKYGISNKHFYPVAMDKKLAQHYFRNMGPIIEQVGGEIVRSETYKKASPEMQRAMLKIFIGAVRNPIFYMTLIEDGNLTDQEKLETIVRMEGDRIRSLLREQGIVR